MDRATIRDLRAGVRVRRAQSLVLHLSGTRLIAEDYLGHRRYAINDAALLLLRVFDRWSTLAGASEKLPGYSLESILRSVQRLLRRDLLVAEGTPAARRQIALGKWSRWGKAATYFHFATRAERFAQTAREVRDIVALVTRTPMPPIYKELPGPRFPLPAPSSRRAPGALGRALLRRRTCREFSPRRLPRRHLETVTSLTFGRLGLIDGGPYGTLLHRASPSGGARHPIEAYLMVFDVAGLQRGLYHYSVKENALVKLGDHATRDQVLAFTWGQDWFSAAAAVFILTAVFQRTMWKYRTPRAYRVVLIDAAHACQNLLLTATSLGLGAYSVAALDEEAIDEYLGIDGVTEGSLYLAGIGWPDHERIRRATREKRLLPGGPA